MNHERQRQKMEKQIKKSTLIHALEVLFVLNFLFIDAALVISQYYDLNMEAQIFEVLLTLFNFSLTIVCSFNTKNPSYAVMTYFMSGSFVFVNLWNQKQYLSFTLNSIIMLIRIKDFFLTNKYIFFITYVWYILMFKCLFEDYDLYIFYLMIIPLTISIILFVRVFKQAIKFYGNKLKRQNCAELTIFSLVKMFDIGIFIVTGLPLYWTFVSKNILYYAGAAFIFHISVLIYISFNSLKLQIFQYSTSFSAAYRTRPFSLQYSCRKYSHLLFDNPEQICNMCCIRTANVMFNECKHTVICINCHNRIWKKGMKKICLVCKKQLAHFSYIADPVVNYVDPLQVKNSHELKNIYAYSKYNINTPVTDAE